MDKQTRQMVSELMSGLSCDKGFRCAEKGFKELCEAEDVGLERHLKCLAPDAGSCQFSLLAGGGLFFCRCPLRVFLAKSTEGS